MKNYEKPVLLVNEELAEGVYAASGSIHWNLSVSTEGGVGNIHEAVVSNTTGVVDDTETKTVTVTLGFSEAVSIEEVSAPPRAYSMSASGSTVTLTVSDAWCRHEGGNAQTYSWKFRVYPETATCTSQYVSCGH